MTSLPYPNSQEPPSPQEPAIELIATAIRFGKFEAEYFADTQGRAALNAMFAAVAVTEGIIKSGRMSPELNEVITAMADTFEAYQKAE